MSAKEKARQGLNTVAGSGVRLDNDILAESSRNINNEAGMNNEKISNPTKILNGAPLDGIEVLPIPEPDSRAQAIERFLAPADPIIVPPTYPKYATQAARLLTRLMTGRGIDPLQAWAEFGVYRLSDVVFRLRGMGWPIETHNKSVFNRFGEECVVADYRLPGETIEAVGEAGKQFVAAEYEVEAAWRNG